MLLCVTFVAQAEVEYLKQAILPVVFKNTSVYNLYFFLYIIGLK